MTPRQLAELDRVTRRLTVFQSFADLVNAKGDYRPTLAFTAGPREPDDAVRLGNAYNWTQHARGDRRRVYYYRRTETR